MSKNGSLAHVEKLHESLRLLGRLFKMSGPQTENAHMPNWVLVRLTMADLTVDDRSWR